MMANTGTDPRDASLTLQIALSAARDFEVEGDEEQAAFRQQYSLGSHSWGEVERYRRRNKLKEARRHEHQFIDRLQKVVCKDPSDIFLKNILKGRHSLRGSGHPRPDRQGIEVARGGLRIPAPQDARRRVAGNAQTLQATTPEALEPRLGAIKGLIAIFVVAGIYSALQSHSK